MGIGEAFEFEKTGRIDHEPHWEQTEDLNIVFESLADCLLVHGMDNGFWERVEIRGASVLYWRHKELPTPVSTKNNRLFRILRP